MSSTLGNNVQLSLFGDSANATAGITIQGLPAGFTPDRTALSAAAGEHKVLSGMHGGQLSGTPLTVLFPTAKVPKLRDATAEDVIRPGMGDLGEYRKSGGNLAVRGGGHLLQGAPLQFAGELMQQILSEKKIELLAHISRIGEIEDTPFDNLSAPKELRLAIEKGELPVIDKRKEMLMKLSIVKTQSEQDTLGSQVEAAILGLPAGVGDPIFAGLKSKLSAALFALPYVTAVEFGEGIKAAEYTGSGFNDLPFVDTVSGQIRTDTNHCGGIEGNMSNGMPVIVKVTFAPSPAIGKAQSTLHRSKQHSATLPPYENVETCNPKYNCQLVKAILAFTIVDLLA